MAEHTRSMLLVEGRGSFTLGGSLLIIILLAIGLFGCQDKPRSNPLDPGGVNYHMPTLDSLWGPYNGETLSVDSVEFGWLGHSTSNVYQCTLTNTTVGQTYYQSTDWDTVSTKGFSHLDDGTYDFGVQIEYSGETIDTTYHVLFTIKSVPTPSLVFLRKFNQVTVDSSFEVDIWVNGIQGLFAGDLAITFDKNAIQLINVSQGDGAGKMGLTQLVTPDYSLSKIVSNANNLGQFGISTAFLGSTNSVFSGTGSILKMTFRAVRSGPTLLNFQTSDLRDVNDKTLTIYRGQSATVEVK